MKTSINKTFFAIATFAFAALATCLTTTESQAQQPQQLYVQPAITPQVAPPVVQKFYFGFSAELVRLGCGTNALQVASVTPGSPAHLAGLEPGDAIRTVNGQGFAFARDSYHAVDMLNQYVSVNAGPVPTGPVPVQANARVAYVPPTPIANMIVRNVRNGQNVSVTVRPSIQGGLGPVPVAAAQVR